MTAVLIAVALLALFEIVAIGLGADSRDGDDWTHHRHNHPGGARRMPL